MKAAMCACQKAQGLEWFAGLYLQHIVNQVSIHIKHSETSLIYFFCCITIKEFNIFSKCARKGFHKAWVRVPQGK